MGKQIAIPNIARLTVPFRQNWYEVWIDRCKRASNYKAMQLMHDVGNENGIYCPNCKNYLPVYNFRTRKPSPFGVQLTMCSDCRTDCRCPYNRILANAKTRQRIRNEQGRGHGEVEIDIPFLKDLYKRQNGKCFYTGLDIFEKHRDNDPFNMSLERLNNLLGYTKDNCMFICGFLQFSKGNFDEVSTKELIFYNKDSDDYVYNQDEVFSKDNLKYMKGMCNNMKSTSKKRYKKRKREDESGVVDENIFELLVDTIKEQGNRCNITGIPLKYEPNNIHTASVDRYDNRLGYVKGNIQIVVAPINTHMMPSNDIWHKIRSDYFKSLL